jgi:hypothetical protein
MIPMARYLISVLYDTTDSATAEEMSAIDAFNERLEAERHWVFAAAGSKSCNRRVELRPLLGA